MQTNSFDKPVTKADLLPNLTEEYEKRYQEFTRQQQLRYQREDIDSERQQIKFWGEFRDKVTDEKTKEMVNDILSHHLTKLSGLLR